MVKNEISKEKELGLEEKLRKLVVTKKKAEEKAEKNEEKKEEKQLVEKKEERKPLEEISFVPTVITEPTLQTQRITEKPEKKEGLEAAVEEVQITTPANQESTNESIKYNSTDGKNEKYQTIQSKYDVVIKEKTEDPTRKNLNREPIKHEPAGLHGREMHNPFDHSRRNNDHYGINKYGDNKKYNEHTEDVVYESLHNILNKGNVINNI